MQPFEDGEPILPGMGDRVPIPGRWGQSGAADVQGDDPPYADG